MELLVPPAPVHEKSIPLPEAMRKEIFPWINMPQQDYPAGNIYWQSFKNDFTNIYKYIADVHTPVLVYPVCTAPVIALQFTLAGTAQYQIKRKKAVHLVAGKAALCYLPAGRHKGLIAGKFSSLHFEFSLPLVKELAPGIPQLQELLLFSEKKHPAGVQLSAVPITYVMMNNLKRLEATEHRGGALDLELKSIIIALLTAYRETSPMHLSPDGLPDIPAKATIIAIRNDIVQQPNIHLHSLRVLSKKHFMNEKSLSRAFSKIYGIKISDFVLTQVMQHGLYLLENTTRTVADIAEELGYSNDYNFSRTFWSTHGVYPRSFRERKTTF
jgi:AraC-like DNA-binding protein